MRTNRSKRTHILLPEQLAKDIDAIAGRRGRSAFLVQTAREAVRRAKLLDFLRSDEGWNDADHPELRKGAASWVRKIRLENEKRIPQKAGNTRSRNGSKK
ncbi:MAG TPA: hypothetical protein VKF79_13015 [Candidatus Acidoferrum sp.]|nr:hypothetical protein [Candidatus Acidoferrum sp.]